MADRDDESWRLERPRGPFLRDGSLVKVDPDLDHPCSKIALDLVPDPRGWTRRSKDARCKSAADYTRIPPDAGVITVRPNVQQARDGTCRTIFKAWSIYSEIDGCKVAEAQDVWVLGARFVVNERELSRARRERTKNVNSWVYGLYAPTGSVTPDEASGISVGFDPWSIVHPGFFEANPANYRSRLGRDIRDDRFDMSEQYAAAHLWIDPVRRTPGIRVYPRLIGVSFSTQPSGALAVRSLAMPALAGLALGAGIMHLARGSR